MLRKYFISGIQHVNNNINVDNNKNLLLLVVDYDKL
jgi:hypothetical protein